MLKLYKKTITVATMLGIILFAGAYYVNCNVYDTAGSFVQNCLIGIACSFVVVVITTSLQYLNEHKKVFYEYKKNLRKLYINVYTLKTIDIDNAPMLGLNTYIENIDQCFENLKKCAMDLCWFRPKYKRKYNNYFSEIFRLMMIFIRDQYDKPRKALIEISAFSAVEIMEKLIRECATDRIDMLFVENMLKERMKSQKKKIHIKELLMEYIVYIISIIVSAIFIVTASFFYKIQTVSSILIGIGCSAITAALMAIFIEIKDKREYNKKIKSNRKLYFEKLNSEVKMLIQRILWFDERFNDEEFNWNLDKNVYNSLQFMLFTFKEYPSDHVVSYEEAEHKIKECEEKYGYPQYCEYDEDTQNRINRMFSIISDSAGTLKGILIRMLFNDIELASEDYISLSDLESLRFDLLGGIELLSNPGKNYAAGLRMIMAASKKIRLIGGYSDSIRICLQGTVGMDEL